MTTYETYAEWFREYREAYRKSDDVTQPRLCNAEPEYAERLEYEKKDPDWYLTTNELVDAGKLKIKLGAQ